MAWIRTTICLEGILLTMNIFGLVSLLYVLFKKPLQLSALLHLSSDSCNALWSILASQVSKAIFIKLFFKLFFQDALWVTFSSLLLSRQKGVSTIAFTKEAIVSARIGRFWNNNNFDYFPHIDRSLSFPFNEQNKQHRSQNLLLYSL